MSRFGLLSSVWALALALGFIAVFTLGAPLPNAADELEAAYRPQPPVTRIAAEGVAATIVRLEYPDLAAVVPVVERQTDYGLERWVISYTAKPPVVNGVTISIAIETGIVEVIAYP